MEVCKDWELQAEIEYSQLAKKYLAYPEKDILNLVECGTLEYYDKRWDILGRGLFVCLLQQFVTLTRALRHQVRPNNNKDREVSADD